MLLLNAPNVKGKSVDSNFQIIDLLVPPSYGHKSLDRDITRELKMYETI